MARRVVSSIGSPSLDAGGRSSGKWKIVILDWLQSETLRYGALGKKIPGVSEPMPTQQLRELEEHGIVERKGYAEVPPKVECSLTEYGRTLRPITELMCVWPQTHMRRTASR